MGFNAKYWMFICVLIVFSVTGLAQEEKKRPKGQIILPAQPSRQAGNITARQLLENLEHKKYSGEVIDFNFGKAEVRRIMLMFSRLSGITFEIDPDITEKMTCRGNNVPWDQCLDFFLKENQLQLTVEGDKIRISKLHPKTHGPPYWIMLLLPLLLAALVYAFFHYRSKNQSRDKKDNKRPVSIPPRMAEEYLKKLVHLFEIEKVYRQESLSLQILADRLSIPAYQLSQVINDKLGKTFFELLNSYRVEEVKQRLSDPAEKNKRILDIAYEAGFNTKTAFNRTFKKYTGMTPTAYREKLD